MGRATGERGQAAVESALTLPLVVFIVLGSLQLFLLLQAKQLAQYAVYQAARVGSVSNGRCDAMVHAAVLTLTPAIRPFVGPTVPGSPGQQLGAVFNQLKDNDYGAFRGWGSSEAIVWLIRESPRFPRDPLPPAREHFDDPLSADETPVRLELRQIFWAPLLVPFADWVFSRMALAHLGLQPYTAQNPLLPSQQARWADDNAFKLASPIATELVSRVGLKHYVFPIETTYTMRMMSPVKLSDFAQPNCAPAPSTL
jgi:hypothetical protein